ncbi:unnamed protein product [Ambrosiozyma monospora]|uniref:Unnamed protein product n=1 Tax=Ambrosiozyma monospora TaxID=43982 RepID=A0ACB5TX11_AMBMO|nr:unnamed protein product [Ambrosiozyma monospora]
MLSNCIITTTLLSLSAVASATEIALYWGQSTAKQDSLATYCSKGDADIFILSFMNNFSSASNDPPFEINFSDACGIKGANGILKCDTIATDINTCQKLGKKVFLSLGGGTGSYGFKSKEDGEAFADTLWNYFGAGKGVSTEDRPFGDSIVDGFDFDIEMGDILYLCCSSMSIP